VAVIVAVGVNTEGQREVLGLKDRITWARMDRLADEWLPPPHVLHPWPEERLAVKYPR
jgi:hypothetical protein